MKFLALCMLLFNISVAYTQDLILPVINVYDADTIETRIPLPEPLDVVYVRLLGIDSPEVPAASYIVTGKLGRAKCNKEAKLALNARDFVRNYVISNNNIMYVRDYKYGSYARRIVADVFIKDIITSEFIRLADLLLQQGYAVPYNGKHKRSFDWCN